jgi:hypothetical protein
VDAFKIFAIGAPRQWRTLLLACTSQPATYSRESAHQERTRWWWEREKSEERSRGFYIHPELYGAPQEKQIEWARHPQTMTWIKEQRRQVRLLATAKPR